MVNVILDPRSNELVTPSTTREGWGQVCLQSTQTVINNCQQHPDILTNISLTIDGDNVIPFIDPCCSSFFETLKIAISEINNV